MRSWLRYRNLSRNLTRNSAIKQRIQETINAKPKKKPAEFRQITDDQLLDIITIRDHYIHLVESVGWLQLCTFMERDATAEKLLKANQEGQIEKKLNHIEAYQNLKKHVAQSIEEGNRSKEILARRKQQQGMGKKPAQ